jgi:hypothetical protein
MSSTTYMPVASVPPQTATEKGTFETKTFHNVHGKHGSISRTIVNVFGKPAILPVWFGPEVAALVVIPIELEGGEGMVPPPAGYTPVEIGSDGEPTERDDGDDDDPTNTSTSTTSAKLRTSTTSRTTSTTKTRKGNPTGYLIFANREATKQEQDSLPDI